MKSSAHDDAAVPDAAVASDVAASCNGEEPDAEQVFYLPGEKRSAVIEVVARRPPARTEKKMFKAEGSAPDDDNQLIISSSSEDDVKNGQRIKTEENKMAEVKAQLAHLTARYSARKAKREKER